MPFDYIVQSAKTHFFHTIIKTFSIDIEHLRKVYRIVKKRIRVRDADIPTRYGEETKELTINATNLEVKLFLEIFDMSKTQITRIYI